MSVGSLIVKQACNDKEHMEGRGSVGEVTPEGATDDGKMGALTWWIRGPQEFSKTSIHRVGHRLGRNREKGKEKGREGRKAAKTGPVDQVRASAKAEKCIIKGRGECLHTHAHAHTRGLRIQYM